MKNNLLGISSVSVIPQSGAFLQKGDLHFFIEFIEQTSSIGK
ncbi:hypothetical protein ACFFJJ_09000 [Fictibacillus phosphorivorans]